MLDEPSIGLHPSNIEGLTGVMRDLTADGNSVVLVDHDTQVLAESDWMIEMGPKAGADGGRVIAQGTVSQLAADPNSQIGPFLSGKKQIRRPSRSGECSAPVFGAEAPDGFREKKDAAGNGRLFSQGEIRLSTGAIHTVKPLEIKIPKGRLTAVTGVSGSGKTTLVLESLVPALSAWIEGKKLPDQRWMRRGSGG